MVLTYRTGENLKDEYRMSVGCPYDFSRDAKNTLEKYQII
jgi:hypothetical protein